MMPTMAHALTTAALNPKAISPEAILRIPQNMEITEIRLQRDGG